MALAFMSGKLIEYKGKIMERRFIGVVELADYLGLTKGTVYVWVCRRKIPYVKVGRLVKFDLHKIEKWLEETSTKVYN